jgi:hypothetical protein
MADQQPQSDADKLQALIDATPAGGSVLLPPGNYMLDRPLLLYGGRRLIGGSEPAMILHDTGYSGDLIRVEGVQA